MAQPNDNSSTGVILGILIAVLIAVGGYYFLKSEDGIDVAGDTTVIEAPETNVAPAAGDAVPTEPAPAP